MDCQWLGELDVAQTLVVTVNVGSGATPSTTSWELTANAASQTENLVELDRISIEILAEYAGTAIALCDGADQPVTEARNTGAKDLTFVRAGTGFPLPAGESITVNWPNGTDGAPIPVLDWRMLIPGFTTVVESGTLQLPDCAPPDDNRIFGDTRFSTAVAVAQEYIPLGCEYVIANGLDFPDGLASAVYDLPILLTTTDDLPADTAAELESLATSGCTGNLVLKIVGGTAAVSSAQQDLLAATYGATVTRVFGTDRYATSIAIANEVFAGITPFGEAIITTGLNFPDALAGGVLSAYRGAPILLNDGDSVRADVGDFLDDAGITKVYILGGTDAVPASVETELSTAHGVTTERLDGANRWGTAVAIADEISDLGSATGPSNNEIVLVNGLGFADALAAAPYAFDLDVSPILLTAADSVPAETAAYHQTYCDEIDFITIIGGLAAVSAGVADAAVTAATCPTP
jgi:putative cell wall-binding protein